MRRILFNLTIALLAFGIGIYFIKFYPWKVVEKNDESVNQIKQEFEKGISFKQDSIKETQTREKYLSDKEKALLLFEITLNKWLNGEKVEMTVAPSIETIQKIKDDNFSTVDENYFLRVSEKNYKASLIDVNNDGQDELTILSNCSPPEYCELWVFEKTKDGFTVILKTYTTVENFSLRESKTEEYFDIQTTHSYPLSETSLGMTIYKFDGEQYVGSECYDYIYLYKDENGDLKELKQPKLIPLHCC